MVSMAVYPGWGSDAGFSCGTDTFWDHPRNSCPVSEQEVPAKIHFFGDLGRSRSACVCCETHGWGWAGWWGWCGTPAVPPGQTQCSVCKAGSRESPLLKLGKPLCN